MRRNGKCRFYLFHAAECDNSSKKIYSVTNRSQIYIITHCVVTIVDYSILNTIPLSEVPPEMPFVNSKPINLAHGANIVITFVR